jgi:UDP-3-O-acyl-N-acetylglucosamine deacetylase
MDKPSAVRHSFQHTIKEEVIISGAGIHSGEAVTMRLKPSNPNTGILKTNTGC